MVIFPEPVHLVLRYAELEIFRQLDAEADCALKRNPGHRCGVFELRHVIAKGKRRREKHEQMAREGFAKRLYFEIAAQLIARVSVAVGIRSAGGNDDGVRLRAAAEVRLVVWRSDVEI